MPRPTLGELRRTRLYSEELGIELPRRDDAELFKWFLASLLFGGHISETIAKRTYHSFAHERLLAPRRILAAGWDFLREMRPVWPKADPRPLPAVCERAQSLGIDLRDFGRHTITFTRIEAGLIRLRHPDKARARG